MKQQPGGYKQCVWSVGPGVLRNLDSISIRCNPGITGRFSSLQRWRSHREGVCWVCWLAGTRPRALSDSPQSSGGRLPDRQTGVQQQRPEPAHGIATRQVRQRRPLLHQPGQPRAGALADLGARVLELREPRRQSQMGAVSTRAPPRSRGRPAASRPGPRPTFSRSSAAGPSSSSSSVPFAAAAASA